MKISNDPDCLKNKIILITGASDGIGKATAIDCAKHGATVILMGKTQKKLELVYDEIENKGYPEAIIHPLDFEKATPDDYINLHDSILNEFGLLDGLINNAAWLGAPSPIEHSDINIWYRVMQINLNAPYILTKTCLPLLAKSKNSSIIFTLDKKEGAYWGAYGISKFALQNLMETVAKENVEKKICVTGFDPGAVRTNLRTRSYPAEDNSEIKKPENVSPYFVYLISTNSEIENGKAYMINDFN